MAKKAESIFQQYARAQMQADLLIRKVLRPTKRAISQTESAHSASSLMLTPEAEVWLGMVPAHTLGDSLEGYPKRARANIEWLGWGEGDNADDDERHRKRTRERNGKI